MQYWSAGRTALCHGPFILAFIAQYVIVGTVEGESATDSGTRSLWRRLVTSRAFGIPLSDSDPSVRVSLM
jgi:hypothetical protein